MSKPWRTAIETSLAASDDPTSRYLALATVGLDGWPSVRTLVFRGFADGSDVLLFAADARSRKIGEIEADAAAEACWYFAKTREQYRIRGRIGPVEDERDRLWRKLSNAVRAQFAWPTPGLDWTGEGGGGPLDPESPPATFVVLGLDPTSVDRLDLRPDPPVRLMFDASSDEQGRRVNA